MNAPTGLVALRRIAAGQYQTLDGRYNIERQDGQTECEHPLCDPLHQKYHARNDVHWITYSAWHVWDNERDEYAFTGLSEYETKRAAHQALSAELAEPA